jgi:spore maturation protein CgeB
MPRNIRIAYLAHSVRSDWNNGNAHFIRGLLRALGAMDHDIVVYEPAREWSIDNLHEEAIGKHSLERFARSFPDLKVIPYEAAESEDEDRERWRQRLCDRDAVIMHEWNSPMLANVLLGLRCELGYRLVFHDTHHRASSTPEQIRSYGLENFDGILVFGDSLRRLYRDRFGIPRVWTLHEAADTSVFGPIISGAKENDIIWIGNWGDGERTRELCEFLLRPAASLASQVRFKVYGVRYPAPGLDAMRQAGVDYGGYLPNLDAPLVYSRSRLTLHVPRQQYSKAMEGIPTIRVFEALACGIPLVSAPWNDVEDLFRAGDICFVKNEQEMRSAIRFLLCNSEAAREQAQRGLETLLARHTCKHRAQEMTAIFEELLS